MPSKISGHLFWVLLQLYWYTLLAIGTTILYNIILFCTSPSWCAVNDHWTKLWVNWHFPSIVKPTRCTSFWNLIDFVVALYMFRMVFPSIIHLLASKQLTESVWHITDAVCTVLDSWWWMERLSKTCRVLLQNKINLRNWCISLVLL